MKCPHYRTCHWPNRTNRVQHQRTPPEVIKTKKASLIRRRTKHVFHHSPAEPLATAHYHCYGFYIKSRLTKEPWGEMEAELSSPRALGSWQHRWQCRWTLPPAPGTTHPPSRAEAAAEPPPEHPSELHQGSGNRPQVRWGGRSGETRPGAVRPGHRDG